jgi:hypothetical protein
MTELARTPSTLRRLFQTVDLAPLPQDQVIAEGVAIWKKCREGRELPDMDETLARQSPRVRDQSLVAFAIGRGDYRIAEVGYRTSAALSFPREGGLLSIAHARRLAARLRRLFELVLDIDEPADVRFVERSQRYEVFAAPVITRDGTRALFSIISFDPLPAL